MIKCDADFVIKIKDQNTTECSSMMFLEHFLVSISTLKLLDIITIDAYTYLFMSYMKSDTLDKI